ncbi:MAG: ribonuclease J [Streptococcaceae bacterium]|jgi:ribonuclease J|nr:ribonuclease J [Streptococcaceae bacterium]
MSSSIKIIPLGGVRENGKNLYIVEVNDEIFVFDVGLKYPDNSLLGIDVVIPDFTYLIENKNRISAIFLTHGHADAIGALPYLLEGVDAPVFGSKFTIELAKSTVKQYDLVYDDFHIVDADTEIEFQNAVLSFFRTTHTIADSLGIVLTTDAGSIVYTGDFKFDQAAMKDYATDFARLAEIGGQNVLALLSESSNSENPMQVASERATAETIRETIAEWDGRIIVASVASNLARIQQVFDAAAKAGRKVFLTGLDLERIVKTALKHHKLHLRDADLLINPKQLSKTPDNELLVLETGKMGEPIKSLQRMAKGHHKYIKIKDGDLVYVVTTPSIAMETQVAKTEDLVYRAGGQVKLIASDLRVSGHANPQDLQLMMNFMKPRYFIPIQGEYRQLSAHAKLAGEVGITSDHIFILNRGDILEYKQNVFTLAGSVPAENVMIDGIGVGDIGNIVLRDRKVLSEDGIFIAVITINRRDKTIISKAKVTTRGFVYVKQSRDLMKESQEIVDEVVANYLAGDDFEWAKLKQEIRERLNSYLFDQTKRRPVILPVVMEVSRNKLNKK